MYHHFRKPPFFWQIEYTYSTTSTSRTKYQSSVDVDVTHMMMSALDSASFEESFSQDKNRLDFWNQRDGFDQQNIGSLQNVDMLTGTT